MGVAGGGRTSRHQTNRGGLSTLSARARWSAYDQGILFRHGGVVAIITEAAIRELAGLRGRTVPITSCYLNVDGRRLVRRTDVEHELDGLLRGARKRANGYPSVHDDLNRIEAFVRAGIDRHHARGLAIFAGSACGLWKVIELSKPVQSQLVINDAPAVGQLELMLQEHEPIGVLLADKQRVQLYVFAMGQVIDHCELLDARRRGFAVRGERERETPASHRKELAHRHLRHAAQAAFDLWQDRGFQHLVIGGPDFIVSELEQHLHPYLRERYRGRVPLGVGAACADVQHAAEEVELAIERAHEMALVASLRQAAAGGGKAVAGLGPTLLALNDHRVERVLISRGFAHAGWRCPATDALRLVGPINPANGVAMVRVDDVVEACLEEALTQGVPVTICVGNADLDVLGRIGALLRY